MSSLTNMTEPLMELRNVHRTFLMGEIEVPVLRGVELDIYPKELLIILGESGSGKSTLLNMIGGIDTPTQGEIVFQKRDITKISEKELTLFRRKEVGFVFQFYNLIPTLTAVENVAVATEIAPSPIPPQEALALVGLEERLEHFPSQLSGGQQQRVAIARALAKRPQLLLCDEPTGALDQDTTILVLELLQRINRETGTTMIMITHSTAMVPMADRSAVISDGKVTEVRATERPVSPAELEW